jgi:hypothetical protein
VCAGSGGHHERDSDLSTRREDCDNPICENYIVEAGGRLDTQMAERWSREADVERVCEREIGSVTQQ